MRPERRPWPYRRSRLVAAACAWLLVGAGARPARAASGPAGTRPKTGLTGDAARALASMDFARLKGMLEAEGRPAAEVEACDAMRKVFEAACRNLNERRWKPGATALVGMRGKVTKASRSGLSYTGGGMSIVMPWRSLTPLRRQKFLLGAAKKPTDEMWLARIAYAFWSGLAERTAEEIEAAERAGARPPAWVAEAARRAAEEGAAREAEAAKARGEAEKLKKEAARKHKVREAERGRWIPVLRDGAAGPAAISGLCADRNTGDLSAFEDKVGLWKSADGGLSFAKTYECPSGRHGSSFSIWIDPSDGKRLMLMLWGGSAMTLDGGATWLPVNQSGISPNVDWSDPQARTILCRNGGHSTWNMSTDQGKTWRGIPGKEWAWTFGIFDSKTWVVNGKPSLLRTTDGGASYRAAGGDGVTPKTTVMHSCGGNGYFLAKEGLAVSRDKGATWTVTPLPGDMSYGPFFGKDESHIVVAGRGEGLFESRDAGRNWTRVTAFPVTPGDVPTQADHGGSGTAGYDPVNDVFYFCTKGHPAQRYQR